MAATMLLVFALASVTQAAGTAYKVRRGDSLWLIGQRYGVSVEAITKANGLAGTLIYPGQILTIPQSAPANPSRGSGGGRAWLTEGEIDLLARLIRAEAGGQPYAGQVAVGAVVLNRVKSPLFPNTVSGVIYDPWQFEPVSNGTIYQPADATAYQAALDAINGWDPSGGALYFYNPAKAWSPYLASRPYATTIGEHVFMF